MYDIMGYEIGLKALTFYSSMALYGVFAIYALALLLPKLSKGSSVGRSGLPSKKPSSLEDIIRLSEVADAYERAGDGYTADFMATTACQIAEKFELSTEDIEQLRIACLMHDIGQVDYFDFIQEERKLRPEEKLALQDHSLYGYRYVLDNLGPEYDKAAKWVRWSHEAWDGTGYPDGLVGEQIPLPARILAVVDAYCAMSQTRPYRPAMSQEDVLDELKRYAGIKYDPQIAAMFGED